MQAKKAGADFTLDGPSVTGEPFDAGETSEPSRTSCPEATAMAATIT